MKKEEIKAELLKQNIAFTDKDSKEVLLSKLPNPVVTEKTDPALPYSLFDSEDDAQILSEMQGAVINKFVYSFPQEGKEVVGLSRAGVEQACRESANKKGEVYRIIGDPLVTEDPDYIKVIIKAGRYKILLDKKGCYKGEILLDTAIGSKRQSKKMRTRDGKIIDNKFAYEVAISKAQRNAKMALLPYAFIIEIIKLFRKGGNEQVILADKSIGAPQLQYLHGVASDYGITHEKLSELVKSEFGYEHINELQMSQVQRVIQIIKENQPKVIGIPEDVQQIFTQSNIMKAKGEALWSKALQMSGNNIEKAKHIAIDSLIETINQ